MDAPGRQLNFAEKAPRILSGWLGARTPFRFATDRQLAGYLLGQPWIGRELKRAFADDPLVCDVDYPARRWRVEYVHSGPGRYQPQRHACRARSATRRGLRDRRGVRGQATRGHRASLTGLGGRPTLRPGRSSAPRSLNATEI